MKITRLILFLSCLVTGLGLHAAPAWATFPSADLPVGTSYSVAGYEPPGSGYQGGALPVYLYKNNSLVASGSISCGLTTSEASPGVVTYRFVSWSGATLTRTVNIIAADAPPFGAINTPIMLGNPLGGSTITTGKPFRMDSWAADAKMGSPVTKVEVFVDGISCGLATLGQLRQDVADYLADQRYKYSGYLIDIPGTVGGSALSVGVHTISAKAWDDAGNMTNLGSANFDVVANQAPFGCLDTEFSGTYDIATGSLPISGWAVDPDTGAPVASVELHVDGAKVGTCTLGLSRPDLVPFFNRGDYTNGGISGAIPLGSLAAGTHQVSLKVLDAQGASSQTSPKSFTVASFNPRVQSYLLTPLRVLLEHSKVTVTYQAVGTSLTSVVLKTNPVSTAGRVLNTWTGQANTVNKTVEYTPASNDDCRLIIVVTDSLNRTGSQSMAITDISVYNPAGNFAADGLTDAWKKANGYSLTEPLQLSFEVNYDAAGRLDTYSGQTIHQDVDVDAEGSVLESKSSAKKP